MTGDFDRLNTGDIVRIMLDDGKLQYHLVTHADGRTCESRPTTVDDWNEQAERHGVLFGPSLSKHPTLIWNHGYPYWEDEKPPILPTVPRFTDFPLMPALQQFPRTPPAPTPQWFKPYLDAQADSLRKMAAQSGIPLPRLEPLDANASYDDVLLALLAYQRYAPPRPVDPNWTPPKYTLRQRFRGWRRRTNQRVQQWIHDHLPEAYCDN